MMERTSATRRAVLEKLLRSPTPPSGIQPLPRIDHTDDAATRHYLRDDQETATSLADMPEPRSSQRGYERPSQRGFDVPSAQRGFDVPSAQRGFDVPSAQRGFDGPPPSMPTPTEHLPPGSNPGFMGGERPRVGSMPSGSLGTTPMHTGSFGSEGSPRSGATFPSPFAPTDPAQQAPLFGMDHSATGKFSDPPQLSAWQRMSFARKALVILFLPMVASVIVLFTDVLPKKGGPAARGSAAPSASASSKPIAARNTAEPKNTGKLPEKLPEPSPKDAMPVASEAIPIESATPIAPEVAQPKMPEGEKTLQRKAVDAFVAGSYEEAARLYDQLAKQHPENPAYAAAANIARAKAAPK
jgi:hypothetical protein